ncbi:hypothetical protein SpiBuddy_0613 [Sphaerochaeta globosa str. Buddy]|uniref:Uncharacterized protein n=2 Tax=Sphaerochaeta TaxID=399320 RepID=F0RY18_SPHGB|nr:hypothetical protein SpiBuddy_0613 [Sphaerochaeta globosa str. Buddy]
MKKTIAILLVLVIGMVGVFAATAPADVSLFVKTSVYAINEMKITAAATPTSWTTNAQAAEIRASSSVYDSALSANSVNTSSTSAQIVGYLQTRTNNRLGVEVKVQASKLKYNITTTQDVEGIPTEVTTTVDSIDYTVTGGANPYNTASNTTAVSYMTIAAGTGLRLGDVKTVQVTLESNVANKTAGNYVGDITFNYTVN